MQDKKITELDYIKLYKEVFSSPSGQMVLMDICKRFHVDDTTRKPSDKMPEDMVLREGQRQVALYLLKMVNYDIDKYIQQREFNKIEVQYER